MRRGEDPAALGPRGIRLAVGPAQSLQFYIREAMGLLEEELERLCPM